MATKPHGREVKNTLDDGSATKAEQPAELEATHGRPEGELVTDQVSSSLIGENQELEAKIQELLRELSEKTEYIEKQKNAVAESARKAFKYKTLVTSQEKEAAEAKKRHLQQQQSATIRIEGFKPINRRDQLENHAPHKQQAETQRINELEQECNQLKRQLAEVEKNRAAERQAAAERIAKLEAEYNFLRDDNKQTDNNHREALNKWKKWKDRYHDQQEKMKVLQEKCDGLEGQLNTAQHQLTKEARIAETERQGSNQRLTELKDKCNKLKEKLTTTENKLARVEKERDSEQQTATKKITEVSKECCRLRQQITTTQSELVAKADEISQIKESIVTEREIAIRKLTEIENERDGLNEQVATVQVQLATEAKKALKAEAKEKSATRRVTELEEECKGLRKQLSNREAQLDGEVVAKEAFAARLEHASKRIREFEKECNRLKEKMTADTKNASDQISELKKECQVHKERATNLEEECLGYEKRVATLECELETAIEERSQERAATAERKLANMTAEAHEANVNLQAAVKRVNELERYWKRSDKEMSALKEQVATAEGQLATKTEEAHEANVKLEDAVKRVNELENSWKVSDTILQEQVATAERQLATKTEEAHEANVKLEDAVKRVHELEKARKPMDIEISTLKGLLALAKAARTTKLERLSKQIRELQEQNDHLLKEQTETAAEKKQACDQIAKLEEECRLYKEQANKLEEERRRYNEEATRLEQECLGYQKRIAIVESQLQVANDLDDRSRAAQKQVEVLSQKIAELEEECCQYSFVETNESGLAMVKTRPDSAIATEELAALQDAVHNGLSKKAKAVSMTCEVIRINFEGQSNAGAGVVSALPMLWHAVSELDNAVGEIMGRLACLTGGTRG